jgi:hypothetical protein
MTLLFLGDPKLNLSFIQTLLCLWSPLYHCCDISAVILFAFSSQIWITMNRTFEISITLCSYNSLIGCIWRCANTYSLAQVTLAILQSYCCPKVNIISWIKHLFLAHSVPIKLWYIFYTWLEGKYFKIIKSYINWRSSLWKYGLISDWYHLTLSSSLMNLFSVLIF